MATKAMESRQGMRQADGGRVWERQPFQVAALMVLGLLTRLPYMSKVFYHWDSVNFAFAMREFNMAKEQPQPPGYILYVWLTRAVDLLFHDAQVSMVAISVAASVLSIVAIYYLARALFSQTVGLVAALYLACSPLFWFYGEIALPHTLDALLVIVAALLLYRAMRGEAGLIYLAVLVLTVAGGIRQQTIVFLGPLILFAIRKMGWKVWLAAGSLGAVLCLAWFIPLMSLTGGMANYFAVLNAFSERFQNTTSLFAGAGWFGLKRNLTKYLLYTLYAWSIFLLPAAGLLLRLLALLRKPFRSADWERWVFLALWIVPVSVFYLVVHMGQQGLVFVYLPALLLISAYATVSLLERRSGRWQPGAVLVLAGISAAVFVFVPEYPLGPGGQRLLTANTLANSDRYFQSRLDTIRKDFPSDQTVILSSNWHHLQYDLPGYTIIPFTIGSKWEADEGQAVAGSTAQLRSTGAALGFAQGAQVLVFDPDLAGFNHSVDLFEPVWLAGDGFIPAAGLGPQDELHVEAGYFEIIRK